MKENEGRKSLSKRNVLLLGILGAVVFFGVGARSNSMASQEATATSTTKSVHSDVIHPPPENRLNKDGFRMCLLNEQVDGLVYEQVPISMDIPLPVRFQCAGPPYDQFATKLEALVQQKATDNPKWARRPQPIPPFHKTSKNTYPARRVLFFGSSHLRQVITALLCQYSDQVISTAKIQGSGQSSLNSFSLHVTMQQNIHLYLVINPPFLYSAEWRQLLEEHVLQMPLDILDLIVVGKFHAYQEKINAEPYLDFLMDNVGAAEDVVANIDPPSFLDIVDAYSGPVIYVGLFAHYGTKSYSNVVEAIEHLEGGLVPPEETREHSGGTVEVDWDFAQAVKKSGGGISQQAETLFTYRPPPPKDTGGGGRRNLAAKRTNLLAIDGRRYVNQLGECSTNDFKTVGTCIIDTDHLYYQEGHRCFGSRGGHPDLIAYDLVEGFHQLLRG